MKTVDPGQILICRQKSTSTLIYSPIWSRESVRAKFGSAVPFKPGARYAQKYVCTIFLTRVDFNPPLGGRE